MADLLIAAANSNSADAAALSRIAADAAAPLVRQGVRVWSAEHSPPQPVIGFLSYVTGPRRPHSIWSDGRSTAWVAGYLSSPCSPADEPGADARVALTTYLQRGAAGMATLDGSFVIALFDASDRSLHVWSDRTASMPAYIGSGEQAILIAPSLKCFAQLPGLDRTWQPGSLAAMALNGAMIGENTFTRGISTIGPGLHLHIANGTIVRCRYWTRTFAPNQPDSRLSPSEFADLTCDALRRHLSRFNRPVLAMSGGFDSRLILAAAQRIGVRLPTVTWGVDRLDLPGSDILQAQAVAERLGVSISVQRLELDQLPAHAALFVDMCDGQSTNLGAYPDGDERPRHLARTYDAVLLGNEMFPWSVRLPTRAMALRQNGINVGRRLRLLRFLLRREVAPGTLDAYVAQQQALLAQVPADAPPHDVADLVYWLSRFPRAIVGQTALFREHLAYVSPLLDATLLDAVSSLSESQRLTPGYLQSLARQFFKDAFEIPMNRKHTRTNWKHRLTQPGLVPRFIVETLLAPCPIFDEWFDPVSVRAWLGQAVFEGRRAPWPGGTFRTQLSRAVRAVLLRPTFRERIVVNMTALKLWFLQQQSE